MASKSPKPSKSDKEDEEEINVPSNRELIKGRPSTKANPPPTPLKNTEDRYDKEGSKSPAVQRKIILNSKSMKYNLRSNGEIEASFEEETSTFTEESNTPSTSTAQPEIFDVPKDSSSYRFVILIVIAVAVAAVGALVALKANSTKQTPTNNLIDCSQFMSLGDKFINQDKKLFKSLKSGIEGMYKRKPQTPSVFLFFSTDDIVIDTLLDEIVKIARNCINQKLDPINLTKDDLNSSNFIERYGEELQKKKIMIVHNIDQMPSSSIYLLHSFADTYNPLVSESILYFTVKVPEKPQGKPIDYIHDYLQDKWKDLASNKRDPLITRFLDQTFYIN